MDNKCDSCYYFVYAEDANFTGDGYEGWCYRYPPVLICAEKDLWGNPPNSTAGYCGEFKPEKI